MGGDAMVLAWFFSKGVSYGVELEVDSVGDVES